jgi:hypothetical protein
MSRTSASCCARRFDRLDPALDHRFVDEWPRTIVHGDPFRCREGIQPDAYGVLAPGPSGHHRPGLRESSCGNQLPGRREIGFRNDYDDICHPAALKGIQAIRNQRRPEHWDEHLVDSQHARAAPGSHDHDAESGHHG